MSANEPDDDQPDSLEVIERLRARCDGYRTSVDANCREIERLEARVAKLEAALKSIWEQDDEGMGRIARAALKDTLRV